MVTSGARPVSKSTLDEWHHSQPRVTAHTESSSKPNLYAGLRAKGQDGFGRRAAIEHHGVSQVTFRGAST